MSKFYLGETDDWDFRLVKRKGHVEMWRKPATSSHKISIYEHVNQDEEPLFHTTKFDEIEAERVFDVAVKMLK